MTSTISATHSQQPCFALPELLICTAAPIRSYMQLLEVVHIESAEVKYLLNRALQKFEATARFASSEIKQLYELYWNLLAGAGSSIPANFRETICKQFALRLAMPTLCRQNYMNDCNTSVLEYLLLHVSPERLLEIIINGLDKMEIEPDRLKDFNIDLLIQFLLDDFVAQEENELSSTSELVTAANSDSPQILSPHMNLEFFRRLLPSFDLDKRVHLVLHSDLDLEQHYAIPMLWKVPDPDSLRQTLESIFRADKPGSFVLIGVSKARRMQLSGKQQDQASSKSESGIQIDHWLVLDENGLGEDLNMFCPISGRTILSFEDTFKAMGLPPKLVTKL